MAIAYAVWEIADFSYFFLLFFAKFRQMVDLITKMSIYSIRAFI